MLIKRNCNECQTEYDADTRYLKRNQGIFCSQPCASLYHGRKRRVKREPNIMCAWCGIDFYRKPSQQKSKSGLYYCCTEHQNLGAENKMHICGPAKGTAPWNKGLRYSAKTYIECSWCKEPTTSKTRIHLACRVNAWLAGDNSITLYRSHSTGAPVDTKDFVKQYLIEIRGDKCEQCGFDKYGPNGSIIQLDHINGNCFDNRVINLKLLCPNCHAMTPTYGSRNRGSGRAHRRKKVPN